MKSSELKGFKAKLCVLFALFMGLFMMANQESQNTSYLSIIPDTAVDGFVKQAIMERASEMNKEDGNVEKYVDEYLSNN